MTTINYHSYPFLHNLIAEFSKSFYNISTVSRDIVLMRTDHSNDPLNISLSEVTNLDTIAEYLTQDDVVFLMDNRESLSYVAQTSLIFLCELVYSSAVHQNQNTITEMSYPHLYHRIKDIVRLARSEPDFSISSSVDLFDIHNEPLDLLGVEMSDINEAAMFLNDNIIEYLNHGYQNKSFAYDDSYICIAVGIIIASAKLHPDYVVKTK